MKFLVILLSFFLTAFPALASENESAYERVMRTGTIRCAYFPVPPVLTIDPNTKKMSGIFYEIMEEMGRRLSLKIEWAEEVDYGVMIEGFKTKRYDMFCNTVWPTPERVRESSFSNPVFYSTVGIFVRVDDHRFDKDFSKLNDPSITLAIKDGDITDSIARSMFPKAKFISVPQGALTQQQLIDVASGKADATFNEPFLLHQYNEAADIKLRDIAIGRPIKYFPNTYMLPANEFQLKHMIDVTLDNLMSEGFVDRVIKKYEPFPNAMYRVAKPFDAPKTKEK